jgi:transposase-like protein
VETVAAPARRVYQCVECSQQFTVTTGTALHDTHLPLVKWFYAVALMLNAKRPVTARQLQRDLHVSYKTAWYLSHRIRQALHEEPEEDHERR